MEIEDVKEKIGSYPSTTDTYVTDDNNLHISTNIDIRQADNDLYLVDLSKEICDNTEGLYGMGINTESDVDHLEEADDMYVTIYSHPTNIDLYAILYSKYFDIELEEIIELIDVIDSNIKKDDFVDAIWERVPEARKEIHDFDEFSDMVRLPPETLESDSDKNENVDEEEYSVFDI